METPFQHLSLDQQVIADFVHRKAIEDQLPIRKDENFDFYDCVEMAVNEVQDGAIISYMQTLAYRRVRCCVRAGTCDCGDC